MRENDCVGRSQTWTMLDDCALLEIIAANGTGKWSEKLQKLQNNKHVCIFAGATYESPKASKIKGNGKSTGEDKLRERWKVLSGPSNKGKTQSPYSTDFLSTPFKITPQMRASAKDLQPEEMEEYLERLETQHAADEEHCRAMWNWIRDTSIEVRERELLGNTTDERPDTEEAQHHLTAADEKHRQAHRARRNQSIAFAEAELKFRKVLTDGLTVHQENASLETRFMASCIVFFKVQCARAGTSADEFEAQVADLLRQSSSDCERAEQQPAQDPATNQ